MKICEIAHLVRLRLNGTALQGIQS